MSHRMCSVAAAVAILLAAGTVRAHHSFAAVFDLSKKFTVSGTLTKIDWRNPHIEIFVLVIGERGERESWVIEADSPGVFRSRNVNKGDFEKAVGQTVTVEAVRARDGSLYGLMQQITFPDGSSVRLPELQRLTGAA